MWVAHRRDASFRRYLACDTQAPRTPLSISRRKAMHVYARVSHARALRLVEALGYESVDVDLSCRNTMESTVLEECDLILLDVVDWTDAMQQYLVEWIRLHTFAPIIVMGKRSYRRNISSVLASGADAIVWLDDPFEVNVAHCKAISRRTNRL